MILMHSERLEPLEQKNNDPIGRQNLRTWEAVWAGGAIERDEFGW